MKGRNRNNSAIIVVAVVSVLLFVTFSLFIVWSNSATDIPPEKKQLLTLVDEYTYNALNSEIEQFVGDKGYIVPLDDSYNPDEIREVIREYYETENIEAVILIGDVPIKYFKDIGESTYYYEEFTVKFYQDATGKVERWTYESINDWKPEVAVSLLRVPRHSTPATALTEMERVEILRDWLRKERVGALMNNDMFILTQVVSTEGATDFWQTLFPRAVIEAKSRSSDYGYKPSIEDTEDLLSFVNGADMFIVTSSHGVEWGGWWYHYQLASQPYGQPFREEQGPRFWMLDACLQMEFESSAFVGGWYLFGTGESRAILGGAAEWGGITNFAVITRNAGITFGKGTRIMDIYLTFKEELAKDQVRRGYVDSAIDGLTKLTMGGDPYLEII